VCVRRSLVEQVRLFASATVVMGVHGAGLSNALFSPTGAALIELGDTPTLGVGQPPCFVNLAHRLGLRYHRHPQLVFSPRLQGLLSIYAGGANRSVDVDLPACDGWCGVRYGRSTATSVA
jgi:hypothetical protein